MNSTRKWTCLLAFLVGVQVANPVGAELVPGDDPMQGPGTLTIDTETNLAWLNLLATDCVGSFQEVSAELGTGGAYEGFRYATELEVLELFSHAGIPNLPPAGTLQTPSSASNYAPIAALQALIGTTNASLTLGVTSTPSSFFGGGLLVTVYAQLSGSNGVAGLSATQPTTNNCAAGHWLVKSATPPVKTVAIDVKPGSDPNCFNINGHGVIPVAIFGSGEFDVRDVDPMSLQFGSFMVRVKGNKGPQCSVKFVNGDAYEDMVCQFEDNGQAYWEADVATATLKGMTLEGTAFEGSDSICIVP